MHLRYVVEHGRVLVKRPSLHNAGKLDCCHVPAVFHHIFQQHIPKRIKLDYRYNHVISRDAYMEAGAARATTSGLLMLAGRISGDSTNCELPHRKGRNLTALYFALRLALV